MKTDTPDHTSRGHAEFSPSQLKNLHLCPGYQGAGGSNAAAEMGTRIHEAMEVRNPSALLNEDEMDIYLELCAVEDELLAKFSNGAEVEVHNEILLDIVAGSQKTYGSCDKLVICGRRGLMIDYKTGVGHIDEPLLNLQAKAYVLGAFQKFPQLEEITFYFLVPRRDEILHDPFERDDMETLAQQIEIVISRAAKVRPLWATGEQKAENLAAGDICQFCKHNLTCPAVTELAIAVVKGLTPADAPDNLDPEFIDKPAEMAKAYSIAKVLERWAGNVRTAAVAMATGGVDIPDHRLQSMGIPRKLVNLADLRNTVSAFGLTEADVWAAAKVSITELTNAVKSTAPRGQKVKKADAFQHALEDAGHIEYGEERFTLRAVKSIAED